MQAIAQRMLHSEQGVPIKSYKRRLISAIPSAFTGELTHTHTHMHTSLHLSLLCAHSLSSLYLLHFELVCSHEGLRVSPGVSQLFPNTQAPIWWSGL